MARRANPRSSHTVSTAFRAMCTVVEQVGDAVYMSAADTVSRANALESAKSAVVGVVLYKLGDTQCLVVSEGLVTGLSGLTVNAHYFLGALPGALVIAPPDGGIVVKVGRAFTDTVLVVKLEPELHPPGA